MKILGTEHARAAELTENQFNVTLPRTTPPGSYLMRVEMIYPNVLPDTKGTQFYVNCAQVNVIGPGGGTPKGFVKFPGAYTPNTPGVKMPDEKVFGPSLTKNLNRYTMPGPAVWVG